MENEISEFDLTPFLALPVRLHVMHIMTLTHSHHEELGKAYEKLDELSDEFMEGYLGEHANVHTTYYDIELDGLDRTDPYTTFRKLFNDFDNEIAPYATSEALQDTRIQMQKVANQLCYFLRMDNIKNTENI